MSIVTTPEIDTQQFRNEFFSESLTSCPGLSYLGRPGLEQIRIRSQP